MTSRPPPAPGRRIALESGGTPDPAKGRHGLSWFQVVLTLTADLIVLLAFLFFALGSAALDMRAGAVPLPPEPVTSPVWPPGARLLAIEKELTTNPPADDTALGVMVQDEDGQTLMTVEDDQPFVLASVAKVYLMAAYLDQVHERGERLGEDDLDLLDPMIRYSDNPSATAVWEEIGELDGLNSFLLSRDIAPLSMTEEGAWGTLIATPREVTNLLRLLAEGELVDPESTQLAMRLLSRIDEDQAWGVSSGTAEANTRVYLKNGWYPEEAGWRINTAGAVQTARGTYFLAVFAYPTPTMEDGVQLVEGVASRINAAMR